MREALAIARPGFVDHAVVAVEEDAATLATAQNGRAVVVERGVVFEEAFFRDSQEARQLGDVAFDDLHFGNAAALGALAAVDGVLYFFGSVAELALDEVVRLNPLAKAEIVDAIVLALAPDLNQVCDHCS